MGRGRQKAKQTKVARELKYFSPETNYDALQRELASGGRDPFAAAVEPPKVEDDEDDEYVDWVPGPGR